MEQKVVFAGFGGQGVLLAGQVLAQAAMISGKEVSWMPSYGPEMRGGVANCKVVISDKQVGSPLVEEPDIAVIMNKPSLTSFEPTIPAGGILVYNSSLIEESPTRTDIRVIAVPCNAIATELGNGKVANMVALGAYLGATNKVTMERTQEGLKQKLGATKAHLVDINIQALERGYSLAKEKGK